MNKRILKLAVMVSVICFLEILGMLSNSALAAAPIDQTFDGKSRSGINSLVFDGIKYTTNNNTNPIYNGLCVGGSDAFCLNCSSADSTYYSGNALTNDFSFSQAPTFFQISSEDLANNFKFNSMYYIATDDGTGHTINIEGYNGGYGGTLVAGVYGIDMGNSGVYGLGTQTVTIANDIDSSIDAEYGGLLTFGTCWNGIDTVRITNNTNGGTVYVVIDSLDFSDTVDISVGDTTVDEDAGVATFTVSLSEKYSNDVTVDYVTADNTAKAGDYISTSGTATIPAGSTTVDITVPVINDTDYEKSEGFYVNLINTREGVITDKQGECRINANDSLPTVILTSDVLAISEALGNDEAKVTATLSNKSYQDVTVELDFTGTAVNGTDYSVIPENSPVTMVIPAGSLSNSITLTAIDNTVYTGNRTVILAISNVVNGTVNGTQQETITIMENDISPYLSNLTISSGTLTLAFAKNTYSYTASVGTDVTSIVVTPTAEVPTYHGQAATIKVNGTTVASGSGIPVNLNLGQNTINIDVTSAIGGATQRYTIIVTRVDTYLLNVKATAVMGSTNLLLGTFDKTVTAYSGSIGATSKIKITATADSPQNVTLKIANITLGEQGTVAISGTALPVNVTKGTTNTINIIVTWSNTGYTKTYTCNIYVNS